MEFSLHKKILLCLGYNTIVGKSQISTIADAKFTLAKF